MISKYRKNVWTVWNHYRNTSYTDRELEESRKAVVEYLNDVLMDDTDAYTPDHIKQLPAKKEEK